MQTPRPGSSRRLGATFRRADAASQLLKGVELVAGAVAPTLGPRGRHVVLQRPDAPPLVTNDGVTIARSIELLGDPVTNQGVQLVKSVASETERLVGDGTTTAMILARELLRRGVRAVAAGADPGAFVAALKAAIAEAEAWLAAQADPLHGDAEMVRRVAAMAARDDGIGQAVADALDAVGADGVVRVQDGRRHGLTLDIARGMRFANGLAAHALMVDTGRRETVFADALVALVSDRVTQIQQLAPVLSQAAAARRPLVLVADEISGDALTLLILNVEKRALPVAAVKAPEFGPDRAEALRDLGIWTGGTVFGAELGRDLRTARLEELGTVESAVITADTTALVGGGGAKADVAERIRAVQAGLRYLESEYEREKLKARLARLDGAVATLELGCDTQTEQEETRCRINDAVQAGRAALRGGTVPGGGASFVHAAAVLSGDPADPARAALRRALEAPVRQLAANAGLDPAVAVERVRGLPFGHGIDMTSGADADLRAAGVFDPAEVVISAMVVAGSIVGTCLLCDSIIGRPPLPASRRPAHPHGHHHHGDPMGHTHGTPAHSHDHAHGHGPAPGHGAAAVPAGAAAG